MNVSICLSESDEALLSLVATGDRRTLRVLYARGAL
jgi:hypothetical protein